MTYPTVNNVVTDARGNPVPNATVVISLVGAPAFSTDVQGEIINSAAVYTDATGAWSTTLKPNALITPSGTYYLVQEPGGASWTIVVPNDTATHTLQSLLVVGPNPPAGLPGVVRYDQAQALSSGQRTQAQTNMGVDPTSLEALLDPRYLNQDDADIDTDVVELLNNSGSATATKLASQFAPFGETARAQAAESTNATAISNETARATAAEATKANDAAVVHLAGAETISGAKAFTAPPTVPTQSPLDNSTKAASTAYADAAVAVEKSRAQTFEASLPATYGQVVMHGSTAGTARPTTSLSVQWVGTVTPTNAVNGDTYLNTTTGNEQVMVASAFQALNKPANDATYAASLLPSYVGSRTNRFDGLCGYNFKASNTARLRAGIGRVAAGTGSCELAFIGDSLTPGSTTSGGAYQSQQGWPGYLRQLNTLLPSTSQSDGLVRMVTGSGVGDPRWTVTGAGWAQSGPVFDYSTTVNDTATYTATTTGLPGGPAANGTSASVWYYDTNDAGQFTVSMNGASSGAGFATVNMSGGGWKRVDLTGFAATNVLTVKHTANGTAGYNAALFAAAIYNPNSLLFHDLGQASSQATGTGQVSWTDQTGTANLPWTAAIAPHKLAVTTTDPHVIFIGLGANDLGHAVAQATVIAGITTLANAFPNSDIVLVATQPLVTTYVTDAAWQSYVSALYDLADSKNVPLIDFRNLVGNYANCVSAGYTVDGTGHFLPFANAMIARAAARALF